MCTAKTEGGQRCYSGAKASVEKAEARADKTVEAYQSAVERGVNVEGQGRLLRRAMKAAYAYEDNLAEYASTDQGYADLATKAADAPTYVTKGDETVTADMYLDAMSEGKRIREHRAEIKRAVRAGELSPERALEQAAYPNEFIRQRREATIARKVAAIPEPTRPHVDLPAYASDERHKGTDEQITDHRFMCENHDQPGSCTEECAELISNMSGYEEGIAYDPTGTSYPAPKARETFLFDPAQRAVIMVTYTPESILDD